MPILLKLQCPDCLHRFSIRMEDDGKLPTFCPACGNRMEEDDSDFVPTQMNIGTLHGKSGDKVYRMLEESSAYRAEVTGDPSLKVTNLKDNLREGDVAAMPVNNAVTQYAAAAKEAVGFDYFQASMGDTLGAVRSREERAGGASVLGAIQEAKGTTPVPTVRGLRGGFGGAG